MLRSVELAPVRPNAGGQQDYRRRIERLVEEMHRSLIWWLSAAYKQVEPEMAQDESPAAQLTQVMRRLARRWQKRFDEAAPDMAAYFATAVADRSDATLKSALRKGGFSVRWRMTRPMNDAYRAVISENVGLIRSIAQQHLGAVEGHVMRSVAAGRDLASLAKTIEAQYGVTKRRAALISRDQNNKATAVFTRVRQVELGVTKARWVHSHAGKEPRPTHVAFGKARAEYDVKEGMWDPDADGKGKGRFVFPGELINCRCVSRSIIEGFS